MRKIWGLSSAYSLNISWWRRLDFFWGGTLSQPANEKVTKLSLY